MRVASFDIFDTLLTRLVALPKDLFLLVAEELRRAGLLNISGIEFVRHRVDAENRARGAYEHGEVNFDEVYGALSSALRWTDAQTAAAKQIELDIERKWIRVAPAAKRRLEQARLEADKILFLSDMYLPSSFIQSLLVEGGLWRDGDLLFVSGETRCSKGAGSLFPKVRETLGEIRSWRHLGDNLHSDVRMPARHGIAAEHFDACGLTRYESVFRPGSEEDVPLWRSKVAGALRFTRLSNPGATDHEKGIWDIGASISGPFFFGYVAWVLEEAVRRGVQRLYFISRDGQILLKIAETILAKWKYPIEVRYLYGSRQAWRPVLNDTLDDWYKGWILAQNTPADLISTFARLSLDPADFKIELAAAGFPEADWKKELDTDARERLWQAIVHSSIGRAAIEGRKTQRAVCQAYLSQCGFNDDMAIGIVDVGWHGSMQLCLDAILKDFPARQRRPVVGFYLGLLDRPESLRGRLFAFWQERPGVKPIGRVNYSFFERFALATHGSLRRYVEENGRVVPDLERERMIPALKWGAEVFQASMVKVTETLLDVLSPGEIDAVEYFHLARKCFDLFVESPSRTEAVVFGEMPLHDQENEKGPPKMILPLSEWEILRRILDRSRHPGWWREGTFRLKRSPSLFLYLLARHLRARLRG